MVKDLVKVALIPSLEPDGELINIVDELRKNNYKVVVVDDGSGSNYKEIFDITGGELIAVGSSGMMQNVSSSSTQNTILVTLNSSMSGDISIGDISYSPKKQYQSVLISSSSLELNHEYTLKTGSSSQNITLTSTVTGSGSQMGGAGMNNGMMNRGGRR